MKRQPLGHALAVRVPHEIHAAVETAAARSFVTASTYVRVTVAERLVREGFLRPAGDTTTRRR